MSVSHLQCYKDSNLIASQTLGTCDIVSPNMIAYHKAVDQLGDHFASYSVEWVE
jgi:hypothetical protein